MKKEELRNIIREIIKEVNDEKKPGGLIKLFNNLDDWWDNLDKSKAEKLKIEAQKQGEQGAKAAKSALDEFFQMLKEEYPPEKRKQKQKEILAWAKRNKNLLGWTALGSVVFPLVGTMSLGLIGSSFPSIIIKIVATLWIGSQLKKVAKIFKKAKKGKDKDVIEETEELNIEDFPDEVLKQLVDLFS